MPVRCMLNCCRTQVDLMWLELLDSGLVTIRVLQSQSLHNTSSMADQ